MLEPLKRYSWRIHLEIDENLNKGILIDFFFFLSLKCLMDYLAQPDKCVAKGFQCASLRKERLSGHVGHLLTYFL